ncbi:hypothetical protein D3C79_1010690 [compost metagenome]
MLGFPFLQQLMIAALGLDDLAVVRVLVLLHLTLLALFLHYWSGSLSFSVRIEDQLHFTQGEAVLS